MAHTFPRNLPPPVLKGSQIKLPLITIIAGCRYLHDVDLVKEAVRLSGIKISQVVSGNANGIDRAGELYALIQGIPLRTFPANWNKYGRKAGLVRNKEMAEYAQALIAIWDGESPGTRHMINQAFNHGLFTFVHRV